SLERRPRSSAHQAQKLDYVQLRRSLDQHGALHPHLHARLRSDKRGHELVAGAYDDSAGQYYRTSPDPAELASRYEVRHPISRVCARQLRHGWFEPAGVDASNSRLRMVWDSGLDWWSGGARADQVDVAGLAGAAGWGHWLASNSVRVHANRIHFVFDFLGAEHLHHISRHGFAAQS